ncbi:MAG: dihydropteroate synthase [Desulfobacterales bacterium]|uniref:Dihydropteroate synthase n=1 Tax=Candidatus Desulfatibia profunda TaxID=2841695 RepID=A0A8J6NP40_9BACT|nr:dihydropteroate synthase [Candidatus Desulfatibia profunda]MBL7181325.1 dihydropteroate synthase [Desulfobacterales bacterium]
MAKNLTTVIKSSKNEVSISRDKGIVIIGERINPTGRNALQAELKAGKFDMVRRDAVAQLRAGAAILDINSGLPRIDEPALLVQMIKEVRAAADDPPICIDTPNLKALEAGLSYYCKDGAKPLVNSVTAETESLKNILPLIKQYGAAVIGLCSGDKGIPETAEDRLKNADKIIEEAAKLGIPAEDIVIDCLVLTLGAKWEAGKIALDAIAMIVDKYGVNITMGASNISFGLPDRENLTSFFMTMAAMAGLTCPICNPLKTQEVIALKAADLVLARDRYGMKWIKGFRARQSA